MQQVPVELAKIKPIGQKIAKRKKHISLTTHACLPVGTNLMTGLLTALAMFKHLALTGSDNRVETHRNRKTHRRYAAVFNSSLYQ